MRCAPNRPDMRPDTGRMNVCRQPSLSLRTARAAAIRASSALRRATNSAELFAPPVRFAATFSMRQLPGATVMLRSILLPSASIATSLACIDASRSKPIRKYPSGLSSNATSSKNRLCAPLGARPMTKPPCTAAPDIEKSAGCVWEGTCGWADS